MKPLVLTCSLLLTLLPAMGQPAHSLSVGDGFVNPLGYHDPSPTFSWKLPAGVQRQTAYRLETRVGDEVRDTGWIESDQSVRVPYPGEPLPSRARLEWRVRFRDQDGRESEWSPPAQVELGLLSAADWRAQWIRPNAPTDLAREPVATLRRSFAVRDDIARARLYVTARGVFELQLNGAPVGDDHFANGWTPYHDRLDTLTYDVSEALRSGENSLQVLLGTGWYAGRLGWGDEPRGRYGRDPELLLQLEITYADGSRETVLSDGAWEGTYEGPILSSSLYDGEAYDARRTPSGWAPVHATAERGTAKLAPKPFAPVRATETLPARTVTEPQPGRFVFDLGQNLVGWPRIRIPVEKDGTVTLRFAEMLNADGTLYTENYRSAKSIDTYTAATTGEIDWRPHFTFHGFRYVELSGLPAGARPQPEWVQGVVLHSDLTPIGTFTSSSPKLNQLQHNIVWGQRGNFLDIPTDCPQRDERLGWTGDAQVFAPTALFNYDSVAFWKSWLDAMGYEQFPDGRIPHVVPDILEQAGSPGWMDAATFIPWEVYVRSGDATVLADSYGMMERLVGWYRSQSVDGLLPNIRGFGDWLQPYADEREGDTPSPLLGAAFYARSAQLLARAAEVLGRDADARRYAAEAAGVREAFARHYFDATGRLQHAPETQTAYVLAIAFELLPPEPKALAAAHLVRLVQEAGGHLRTGFLGTPHLVRVLEECGYPELAYEVLFRESYPSWLYTVNQGATTMWERWNSYSHEAGFGDASMNSFNHYAYGAIGQWLYERVAGLAPDPARPGYRHFFVRPLPGAPLDSARAELETPYGRAVSGWVRRGDLIELEVVVPPNTSATLQPPDGSAPRPLLPGSHRLTVPAGR